MPSYARSCLGFLREQGVGARRRAEWLGMYAFGRVPRRRAAPASPPSRAGALAPGVLERFDEDAAIDDVRSSGLAPGLRLGPEILAALLERARGEECREPLHPLALVPRAPEEAAVAAYATASGWPPVREIARALDPAARRVLGSRATCLGCRVWQSRPGSGSSPEDLQAGRKFHFDLYAWRAVSAFFYLSDVDADAGPHETVLGSHRRKPITHWLGVHRWREADEIERAYGRGSVRTILGPAGTGFFEDPACFHRAKRPARGTRLALQILWGSEDFPAPGFRRVSGARPEGPGSDTD